MWRMLPTLEEDGEGAERRGWALVPFDFLEKEPPPAPVAAPPEVVLEEVDGASPHVYEDPGVLLAVVVELEAEVVEEKDALEDCERSGRRLRLEREVGREKPSSMSTSGGMTKEDIEDWLARRRTVPDILLGVERVGVLLLEAKAEEEEGGRRMVV